MTWQSLHTRHDPMTGGSLGEGTAGLCWLFLAFFVVLLSGCGAMRETKPDEPSPRLDSLSAEVASLQSRQERLRSTLDEMQTTLDTTVAYVQQSIEQQRRLLQQSIEQQKLLLQQSDSLRHAYVLQFVRGRDAREGQRGTTLDVIHFLPGSTTLTPESAARLSQLATELSQMPALSRFLIEGHTDTTPFASDQGQRSNRLLSVDRAEAVQRFLVEQSGLDPSRFETAGYGADLPLVPNDTPLGRQINRRVRIAILDSP